MYRLARYSLILLLSAVTVEANQFVRVTEDVEIPVPNNWYMATDTGSFPVQLVYYNDSAEILLFRSEISADDAITNEADLKRSVDLVIEDVIASLPDGQLHTSTGFYDTYRSGFVLEFGSSDSAGGTPLEHSLKGVIYRHPDGHQILFTIWGKATSRDFPEVKGAINLVQESFVYHGEYEKDVFAPESMLYWPLALVVLVLIGLLLLRPRKRKTDDGPVGTSSGS